MQAADLRSRGSFGYGVASLVGSMCLGLVGQGRSVAEAVDSVFNDSLTSRGVWGPPDLCSAVMGTQPLRYP
jgi:hypothetical protein